MTLEKISASGCANPPTGFSVNGLSASNGLFQTINGLRQSVLFPSEAVA